MDIPEHNHTRLSNMGGCDACKQGFRLEDPTAPPGCTYVWVKTPIDTIESCRRHGFVAADLEACYALEDPTTYTGPCVGAALHARAVEKLKALTNG